VQGHVVLLPELGTFVGKRMPLGVQSSSVLAGEFQFRI